jgi:hypothetical protein
LQFTEDPDNFAIIEGKKTIALSRPPTSGKVEQITDSYQHMAARVDSEFPGFNWNTMSMDNCWQGVKNNYKNIKNESNSTGWGVLTESEKAKGMRTIYHKLKAYCCGYHHLNALLNH